MIVLFQEKFNKEHHYRSRVGKLWAMSPILPLSGLISKVFWGKQSHPGIYFFSMAAFTLYLAGSNSWDRECVA